MDSVRPTMSGMPVSSVDAYAERFEHAFASVYLALHRRDGVVRELSQVSRAVLNHLMVSGPITIGEAAMHLQRAQSVASEIITQLETNGLVERRRDDADRRRVVVWLTDAGIEALRVDASVLSRHLVATALADIDETELATTLRVLERLGSARPYTDVRQPKQGVSHDDSAL